MQDKPTLQNYLSGIQGSTGATLIVLLFFFTSAETNVSASIMIVSVTLARNAEDKTIRSVIFLNIHTVLILRSRFV